jgi:hypothetical protein
MFGLTTALGNLIFTEQPSSRACVKHANRHFLGGAQFVSKWPVIGQLEKEPDRHLPAVVKFKYKKKVFGDLLPPLGVDFSALLNGHPNSIVVAVLTEKSEVGQFARFYQGWEAGSCWCQ